MGFSVNGFQDCRETGLGFGVECFQGFGQCTAMHDSILGDPVSVYMGCSLAPGFNVQGRLASA